MFDKNLSHKFNLDIYTYEEFFSYEKLKYNKKKLPNYININSSNECVDEDNHKNN